MSSLEATASELSLFEREILVEAIEKEPMLLKFIADKYKIEDTCEKEQIKEELMSIAWHPARMQDWDMVEGEKKRIMEIFA